MKAMVFAAGLGTRLRPLTNDRPKALVEVGGRTMLELTLERLRVFGVHEVILNVHHFAEKVIEYLRRRESFGMRIETSREDVLLDTGGGLKKAAWFFLEGGSDEPFIVHNVDVISNIDLAGMVRYHRQRGALATLAVQARRTSRPLLFDEEGMFRGRALPADSAHPPGIQALAFSGIHVLSPSIFGKITEDGAFSIIDTYVRLAALGEKIVGYRADECYWRDLGRPQNVEQAARDLETGAVSASATILPS
jgi:NDP-sugar pyrophosphorylase family protein